MYVPRIRKAYARRKASTRPPSPRKALRTPSRRPPPLAAAAAAFFFGGAAAFGTCSSAYTTAKSTM